MSAPWEEPDPYRAANDALLRRAKLLETAELKFMLEWDRLVRAGAKAKEQFWYGLLVGVMIQWVCLAIAMVVKHWTGA